MKNKGLTACGILMVLLLSIVLPCSLQSDYEANMSDNQLASEATLNDNNSSQWVGHGINLLGDNGYKFSTESFSNVSPFSSSFTDNSIIEKTSRTTDWKEVSASSFIEYLEKYSNEFYIGGELNIGIGQAHGGASSKFTWSDNSEFIESTYNYISTKYFERIEYSLELVNDNPEDLQQGLSDTFLHDLENVRDGRTTYDKFFAKYGTHILTGISVGGKLEDTFVYYTSNTSVTNEDFFETDSKIYAGCGLKNIGVDASVSTGISKLNHEELKKSEISALRDISAIGGNANIINIEDWINSLSNPENLSIIGPSDGAQLILISKIIPAEYSDVALGLESYFYQKGYDNYLKMCDKYGISSTHAISIELYKTNGDMVYTEPTNSLPVDGHGYFVVDVHAKSDQSYQVDYKILNGNSYVELDAVNDTIHIKNNAPIDQKIDIQVIVNYDNKVISEVFSLKVVKNDQLFGGGTGSENDPYLIYNWTQLNNIRNSKFTSHLYYKLMNDLSEKDTDYDQIGNKWIPIGGDITSGSHPRFAGVLDGNDYSISGLKILNYVARSNSGAGHVGFFEILGDKAEVKNLKLNNIQIEVSNKSKDTTNIGGIAGSMFGNSTVDNCYVSGSIQFNPTKDVCGGDTFAGGIVGKIDSGGSVSKCESHTNISIWRGGAGAGGIVGYGVGEDIKISNCINYGSVYCSVGASDGSTWAGGIAGRSDSNMSISHCINLGQVTSYVGGWWFYHLNTGGILGIGDKSVISYCYSLNISAHNIAQNAGFANLQNYNTNIDVVCSNNSSKTSGFYSKSDLSNSSIYANWNTNNSDIQNLKDAVWVVGSGYPQLIKPTSICISSDCGFSNGIYFEGENVPFKDIRLDVAYNIGYTQKGIIPDYVLYNPTTDEYTVCYRGMETTSVGVHREPVKENVIKVSSNPEKLVYQIGDEFDYSGMTVKLCYNNGMSEEVNPDDCAISYSFDKTGTSPVEIRYNGLKTLFNVSVNDKVDPSTTVKKYRVSYELNGGIGTVPSEMSYSAGSVFQISNICPEKQGFDFVGWNDGSNIYKAGSTYCMQNENVVFTADWKKTAVIDDDNPPEDEETPTDGKDDGGFFDGLCNFILVPLFALIGSAVVIPWWFMRR